MTVQSTDAQVLPMDKQRYEWTVLPDIPDSVGFAGSFAGIANGALVVAGGSNFPGGGAPWKGTPKKWYDKIFVLEKPDGTWKEAGKLPLSLGYGVSVPTKDGLLIIGGSNETGHFSHVFLLQWRGGKIEVERFPSLPFALANSCGTIVGDKVFVAGGLSNPASSTTESAFLCFDLNNKEAGWKQLPSWPGPSRMLSVAGAGKDCFFLFSGTELREGKRIYLDDAYVYSEKTGWRKLANLPFPVVAAPSPAFLIHKDRLDIFGGDTGKDAATAASLKENHPGFSDKIISYCIKENRWESGGSIYTSKKPDAVETPGNSIWAPVTTPLVVWKDQIVLPGGEVRPATRTPHVLAASVKR